jgi:hypothetical protein
VDRSGIVTAAGTAQRGGDLTDRIQVLELYPQEWLVADDPGWPTFAQYHSAYAQTLSQAASEVGGQGR